MSELNEVDLVPMDQRAIKLAEAVMLDRARKLEQKFPPESTREEIIAGALLRLVRNR